MRLGLEWCIEPIAAAMLSLIEVDLPTLQSVGVLSYMSSPSSFVLLLTVRTGFVKPRFCRVCHSQLQLRRWNRYFFHLRNLFCHYGLLCVHVFLKQRWYGHSGSEATWVIEVVIAIVLEVALVVRVRCHDRWEASKRAFAVMRQGLPTSSSQKGCKSYLGLSPLTSYRKSHT